MPNWTDAQLKEHYERMKGGDANCEGILNSHMNPSGSAAPSRVSGGARNMNKLELDYSCQLELDKRAGLISWWSYEPITLRLARKTRFTPDFGVMVSPSSRALASGLLEHLPARFEFRETKGRWREDARIKIKVAAEMFPMFKFLGITKKRVRDGGGWNVEYF